MSPRAASLLLLLGVCAAANAQSDTPALAAALAKSWAPATDDPDAVVRDLVTAALEHPRSPIAWLLAEEAIRRQGSVLDPAAARGVLPPAEDRRLHGMLAQKCDELRWYLSTAVDGPIAAGPPPIYGYAREGLSVGPLGDDGTGFIGVVLSPELRFPELDSEIPGRGALARVRVVKPRWDGSFFQLDEHSGGKQGCYYLLLKCAASQPVEAFLELTHNGDSQVFVDGLEVQRIDRSRATAPLRNDIGVRLPAGAHEVLIKACRAGRSSVAARWLDADGWPCQGVSWLTHDDASVPAGECAAPIEAKFVEACDVLERAALREGAEPEVAIAALIAAVRDNHQDLAIAAASRLRKSPPADPVSALALAQLLRSVAWPEELRKSEARALIERAVPALPANHHSACVARVQLLDEQDKGEEGLRILAAQPAGPERWSRTVQLARKLRFQAEIVPMLRQWAEAVPRDPRPLLLLANELQASRDGRQVFELRKRAMALRADYHEGYGQALRNALDVGEVAQARAWIDAAHPPDKEGDHVDRLRWELEIARVSGAEGGAVALRRRIAADPDASAELLREIATQWQVAGDAAETTRCLELALEREPDQPAVREWLSRLRGPSAEEAEFAPFRHDGAQACAAFVAGAREDGASTTLMIDQRILVFRGDGSWISEAHALRRVNDQAGVDRLSEAQQLGGDGEVMLVRTIGADGAIQVPPRIDNGYSMQRLQPGAFVEWRTREHGSAPGAEAMAAPMFVFGSGNEPTVLCELVLVMPEGMRGELRTRNLGAPTAEERLADGRAVLTFRRADLPALPKERFLPDEQALFPIAQVGEDQAPFATLRGHSAQLAWRTRATAPVRDLAQEVFAGCADDRARAAAAWDWCQRSIEDGEADNALDTLLRKKGDRFLLCIALLRAGGVRVSALACRHVRPELGRNAPELFADQEAYQMPGAVVFVSDNERIHLFVDTPRYWPLGAVPALRSGTPAWVVDGDTVVRIVLPSSDQAVQALTVRGRAEVKGSEVRATFTLEVGGMQGFAIAERMRQLKENLRQLASRQMAQQLFPGWTVSKASMPKTEPGSPFRVEVEVRRGGVQPSGAGFVAPLPIPPERFVASYGDRAERTMPYQLPVDEGTIWDVEFHPGPDLRIVRAPDPVSQRCGSLEYELSCTRNDGALRFVRSVRLQPASFAAEDFGSWLRTLARLDRAEQATIELAPR